MDGDYTTRGGILDCHIEVAGNFQKVCDSLVSWIQRADLKKE